MAGIVEEALEEMEINDLLSKKLVSIEMIEQKISEVRHHHMDQNSSTKTIFSIVNTMVGSSVVVFAYHFQNVGVISNIVVAVIIGLIAYKTCSIQLIHFRHDEVDLPDSINRILGRKWQRTFIVSSFVFLAMVGVIYFSLNMNMIYASICFIYSEMTGVDLPDFKVMDFTTFSYQYAGLIGAFLLFALVNLPNLSFVIKLSVIGVFAVGAFIVFTIYMAFKHIQFISKVKLYDTNPTNYILLLGIYSLSFFVHSMILPIVKNNKHHENNARDLKIGFSVTGMIFIVLGSFGALSLAGDDLSNKNTFFDFLKPTWVICILRILIGIQLQTVLPIVWFISRNHFFNLFYRFTSPPKALIQIANILFVIICFAIQSFDINPSLLISITGAIGGFTLMYVIPIKIHMNCLHDAKLKDMRIELISNKNSQNNQSQKDSRIVTVDQTEDINEEDVLCKSFHEERISSVSLNARRVFYFSLILFGVFVMVSQLYFLFM